MFTLNNCFQLFIQKLLTLYLLILNALLVIYRKVEFVKTFKKFLISYTKVYSSIGTSRI